MYVNQKYDYSMKCTTKVDFQKNQCKNFRQQMTRGKEEQQSQLGTYVTEINGVLDRVPQKNLPFLQYCMPLPQEKAISDNHFFQGQK